MADDPITVEAVDAMLARWRQSAGADWPNVVRQRRDLLRQEYEGGGRIHAAWEALLLSRILDEPPPAWVLDYLATVAAGIHNLALASTQGASVTPEKLGRALGSVRQGAGTGFPSDKDWGWAALGMQVRNMYRERYGSAPGKETLAVDDVVRETGASKGTVHAAWKRLQAECPEMI